MTRLTSLLALLLAGSALPGCGAAHSFYYLWDAQRDLAEAQAAGAPDKAVYEYTLALEYYRKAQEEAGYSDFRAAEELARKSSEWASKAADVAEYGSSERELLLEESVEGLPDDTPSGTQDGGQ